MLKKIIALGVVWGGVAFGQMPEGSVNGGGGEADTVTVGPASGLPGAPTKGDIYIINDADDAEECDNSGGGTSVAFCVYTTSWEPVLYNLVADGGGTTDYSGTTSGFEGGTVSAVVPTKSGANVWTGVNDFGGSHVGADGAIQFMLDGRGSAIPAGTKMPIRVPFAGTITSVEVFSDASCSIVVDIWADDYDYLSPDNADSICDSGTCPTLSAAIKSQDLTLTNWTTAVTADDYFLPNVDSADCTGKVLISLQVTKD